MPMREVAARAAYALRLGAERWQHRRGVLAQPDRLERGLRRQFQGPGWRDRLLAARRSAPARFLPGLHDRARVHALFGSAYRLEYERSLADAARARERRFEFFGREFHLDGDIDWMADPVSGQRWPAVFHADVPVHGGDIGFGDVKYVWELNRQQCLIDLGKAYFLAGRPEDLDALQGLVESWIAGNPYATGVNWACALEPAFRAWSWLWAYHFTADDLPAGFHAAWLNGFYDHGRFLARHLEHYSSPYNHLIGEASALWALGLTFQEFEESEAWRRRARHVLETRLGEQFYADGGSVEQSTFYHHATTGFYLLAALLGRSHGQELSASVWRALERALDFSMRLTMPDGRIPEIGGADDGKPIRLEHLPLWDFRPYLSAGAVLFERADFKTVAGRFYEDALWLLGPDGLDRFHALAAVAPRPTAVVLVQSGYAIARTDWSELADYVCFDVGEQAAGIRPDAVPNSMHGHADCLSVVLSLRGRRVLVDSGLYAYNCGGAWESHFRETAAHNTARVDGRDQSLHLGKMAWSHGYRARIEATWTGTDQSWTIGSHDGYARGPLGVTHRRAVWMRPGGYLLVYDEFTGRGEHTLEVNYQFAEGVLRLDDASAVFDDSVEVIWVGSTAWRSSVRCGGESPQDGWICPSLGVRRPAPRLGLIARFVAPRTSVLFVLASRVGADPRISAVAGGGEAGWRLVAVSGAEYTDWVAAAGISDGSPVTTDAPVAVCRLGPSGAIERIHAGGGHLIVDEAALMRLHPSTAAAVR
jgi:hypothetical protein